MTTLLADLFTVLRQHPHRHAPSDPLFRIMEEAAQPEIRRLFAGTDPRAQDFGPYGSLTLPFHSMGAITSLDLFGMNELVIFAYYWANRFRYKRAVDFGANIGLHSILMAILGWEVRAFEPDPETYGVLRRNLDLNDVPVDYYRYAVSYKKGEAEFTRVKGNLTGSHLSGAKTDPYGELDRFPVQLIDGRPFLDWADIAKIDIEGHEAALLTATTLQTLVGVDCFVEIGSSANAEAVFRHLNGTAVRMFSQKTGWRRVERLEDMPTSHRDGSLFTTGKERMEW